LDQAAIYKTFREKGKVIIKEGNGKIVTILKPDLWFSALGVDWVFLLYDLFQIRSVCIPFSEVSLDIVEFASKPTIYTSPASKILINAPLEDGNVRFSLIREPHWNRLLFQISQPVLVKCDSSGSFDHETQVFFPLLGSNLKELFLGPEGEIKIISP
jgi:hypothetical protein